MENFVEKSRASFPAGGLGVWSVAPVEAVLKVVSALVDAEDADALETMAAQEDITDGPRYVSDEI